MKEAAQNMMAKAMAGMMGPEDMPKMMGTMMDTIFAEMSAEDRMAFIGEMMPRCMSIMFSEMDPVDRRAVATSMLERMQDELGAQLDDAASDEG